MSKKLISQNLNHLQKVRILYKTILKLHRGLPEELKSLGDQYCRDEFKRHKKCNPAEAQLFMTEWAKYALTLSEQLGLRGKPKGIIGHTLDEGAIQTLRDEQIVQLYELMVAAKSPSCENETQSEVHNVEIIDNHKK